MPKVPKGEMNVTELRKLVKQYNLKMSVDIKGLNRDELIKTIISLGYKIDHKGKKLVRGKIGVKDKKKRPMIVKLPPPKTAEEKAKAKTKRDVAKKKKEDKAKAEKEREGKLIKAGATMQKALAKKKAKKPLPKGKGVSIGTQTGRSRSAKQLKDAYGHISVSALDKILKKMGLSEEGIKLDKIKRIIINKGEKKLGKFNLDKLN